MVWLLHASAALARAKPSDFGERFHPGLSAWSSYHLGRSISSAHPGPSLWSGRAARFPEAGSARCRAGRSYRTFDLAGLRLMPLVIPAFGVA